MSFSLKVLFLFLDSEKNIVSSSRNFCLKFGTGELSGTLCSENREKVWKSDIGGLVQPRFPLAIFMFENPRNGRFRSVSDQKKKRLDSGEILDGSGRSGVLLNVIFEDIL